MAERKVGAQRSTDTPALLISLIKMCESSVQHEIYTRRLTSIVLFLDAFMFTTFRGFGGQWS